MKLFGRDLSNNRAQFRVLYRYVWYFLKCLWVFRRPVRFLRCYLALKTPEEGVVVLRNGLKIFLSGHSHDIATVFLIFVRKDYGTVFPGEIILDIGANIGVFSLYAAFCGAARVHAFEPNSESYNQLVRNIRENGLEQAIIAHRAAVSGENRDQMKFPKTSSPFNAIIEKDNGVDFEYVRSLTLERALEECLEEGQNVSLLKLDIEGSEYEVLFNAGPTVYRCIKKIRMEYHHGRLCELLAFIEGHGYHKRRLMAENSVSGSLWVEASSSGSGPGSSQ